MRQRKLTELVEDFSNRIKTEKKLNIYLAEGLRLSEDTGKKEVKWFYNNSHSGFRIFKILGVKKGRDSLNKSLYVKFTDVNFYNKKDPTLRFEIQEQVLYITCSQIRDYYC